MQKTRNELKTCARTSLLGHYNLVVTALIFSQLAVFLINIPFQNMTTQGILYMVPSRIALGSLGSIIVWLLSSLLGVGVAKIHLQIARKQETGFQTVFYAFQNNPDRFLGYSAWIMAAGFICLLPGIIIIAISLTYGNLIFLTLIGGIVCVIDSIIFIIFMLSWALAPFIMLDHPELRVREAMKKSRLLMHGQKKRLFLLEFSFLGWILFSIFSLGLALLWIIPYITQTVVWFYLECIPSAEE